MKIEESIALIVREYERNGRHAMGLEAMIKALVITKAEQMAAQMMAQKPVEVVIQKPPEVVSTKPVVVESVGVLPDPIEPKKRLMTRRMNDEA